ncbi:MAG: hypothetical protein ACYTGC_17815, partial [Planctomycetota bacterium]
PAEDRLADVLERGGYEPPGIVVTSVDDPAWTAAVALAAGRAQPLAWLDEKYGRPNQTLPVQEAQRLAAEVERLVRTTGYEYAALGDVIDTVTLCRSIAGRVEENPLPATRITLPGGLPTAGPVAITDVIGRHPDGRRFAFVGWIFGDSTRAAYVAMCSLFLPRTHVQLFNTYGDEDPWAAYGMDGASALLRQSGFEVDYARPPRADDVAWRQLLPGGVQKDLMMVNSQGVADVFALQSGQQGHACDVPRLSTPLAVHMVHSWSMRSPESTSTIGGRWLRGGAYAYVGSAQEPYLPAFVPPEVLVRRLVSGVPLLVAARVWTGHLSAPWRINTYGDPLMLCPPPAGAPEQQRLELPVSDGIDLHEHARELMRRATEDPSGQTLAEAIRTVVLLGRDEIAVRLWLLARQRDLEGVCAAPALGPLFRTKQVEEFLAAWRVERQHDERVEDMLWHLMWARLGRDTDERTLLELLGAMRRPKVYVDLGRLAPQLRRVFGQAYVRGVIQREIEQAPTNVVRERLRELLERY